MGDSPAYDREHLLSSQIRGSSLLLVGRLLGLAITFAVQVLLVRSLSKSAFGVFAYGLALAGVIGTVVQLGVGQSVPRFVPIYEERGRPELALGTTFGGIGVVIALGALATGGVYAFRDAVAGDLAGVQDALVVVVVLAALAGLTGLEKLLDALFAVYSRPGAIFVRKYVLAPGLRLGVVLALIATSAGVVFVAVGYVGASLFGVLLYLVVLAGILRRHGLLSVDRLRAVRVPWRPLLAFSAPLVLTDVSIAVMGASDSILLGHLGSVDDVANIRAVHRVARLNELGLLSFEALFIPAAARLFARGEHAGLDELYWRTAAWAAVVTVPVLLVSVGLAEPFTTLVFGQRYAPAAPLLAILSAGYFVHGVIGLNAATLVVLGRVRYHVVTHVAAAVALVTAQALLIPPFGATGAALGTAAALVGHAVLLQLGLRGSGVRLLPVGYVRVLISAAVAAAAITTVQLVVRPPLLVGVGLAVTATILVLRTTRDLLAVEEHFPEIRRFPAAGWLLGTGSRR